jgi:hypothetical protein
MLVFAYSDAHGNNHVETFDATLTPLANVTFFTSAGYSATALGVSINPDGSFEVLWYEYDSTGYYYRSYAANGTPTSAAVKVNIVGVEKDMAASSNGNLAVVSVSGLPLAIDPTTDADRISVQTFNANLAPVANVNVFTGTGGGSGFANAQPLGVSINSDGSFEVLWQEYDHTGLDLYTVYYESYAANGTPTSAAVKVDTGREDGSSVSGHTGIMGAFAANGTFAVVYTDLANSPGVGGTDFTLKVETFDANLTPLANVTIFTGSSGSSGETTTQDGATPLGVSINPDGSFEVSWQESDTTTIDPFTGAEFTVFTDYYESYAADGAPTSAAVQIDTGTGTIDANGAGSQSGDIGFVAAFSGPALFTTGADIVDFNENAPDGLTAGQQDSIAAGADIYHGLGGNDVVTLPSEANYKESVGGGKTLGWTDTAASTFYTGSQAGDTYTVNGSDGSYFIQEGAGTETININGNGSSTITIGYGTDNVTINGTGANTISAGTSSAGITITGFSGSLTGSSPSPTPGATITLTGADSGNATIGSNSTLELSANSSLNGMITFAPTPGGTLKIDGTTMPTAVIGGFAAYIPPSTGYPGIAPYTPADTIDLVGVPYDPNTGIASLFVGGNSVQQNDVLQIKEKNAQGAMQTYTLQLDPSQNYQGDAFELSNDGNGFTDIQIIKKNPNAGFDVGVYNSNNVSWLWANTNLSWTGFYLVSPPNLPSVGHTNHTYVGQYQTLATQGWKIAPLYWGRQNGDWGTNPSPTQASNQGVTDGTDAAHQMNQEANLFQKDAGVPIFLDVEGGNPPSAVEQAYITSWCSTVGSDGYIPGIYFSANSQTVPIINQIAPAGTLLWAANYNYTVPTGLTILPADPPFPADSNDPQAIAWQYYGSTATTPRYSIGPAAGLAGVDLDTFPTSISKNTTLALGALQDGYISGATVFADANGTRQLAANDAMTTTDANGNFTLTGGTGPLIAFGGTDISTGLPFKGQFEAPAGSTVVDPLTTLVSGVQSSAGLTVAAAQQQVISAFGLPSGIDLTTLDPIAGAKAGDAAAAAAEVANAKVIDTVDAIASAFASAGIDFSKAFTDANAALEADIGSLPAGQNLDLSDQGTVEALINNVAQTEGVDASSFASAKAANIAASNASLDQALTQDGASATLVSDVAALQAGAQTAPTLADLPDPANANYDEGFTVTAGAAVTIMVNGTALTAAQLAADFAKTTSTSGGLDTYAAPPDAFVGTETVAVSATLTNVAGGVSAPATFTLKPIDTTPPAQPAITSGSYVGSGSTGDWSLGGSAEAGSTVTVYDGATKLRTAAANSSSAWLFPTDENNGAIRDFSVTATDAAGNTSVVSADWLEGTPGNDLFSFASEAALAAPAAIFGNGGSDTIQLVAPATLADADFSHAHNILTLALTGASTVTLGTNAAAAGIGAVTTGAGATSITDGNAGTLNVNVSARAVGAALTLSGSEGFTVAGLVGNVTATNVTGALNVTTLATSALSIATGGGSDTINASAMTQGETLTLTGNHAAAVTAGGNLSAGSYTGNVTVTAAGTAAHTITTGSGNDSITAAHGGDTITPGAGADTINVSGHMIADTFSYNSINDSLNLLGSYDKITGFSDTHDGSFNDVLNFSRISGLTTIQGGLNNANQNVNANSIAWFYDEAHNQTLVYANMGGSSVAQSSASLMLVDLAGGNFHLSAQPSVNVVV